MNEFIQLKQSAKDHVDKVSALNSLSDVHQWDSVANQIVNSLKECSEKFELESQQHKMEADQLDAEHKAQSFWKRFTTSNKSFVSRQKSIKLIAVVNEAQTLIDNIESWVERTPDSVEEAKLAISEFNLAKKEIKIQIKELASDAKDVRQAYSQKNAKIATSWEILNPSSFPDQWHG